MRLSIALLAAAIQPALSWGNVGHRTVGYLAEKYLTDEAAAVFGELLANDRNYDFSDAATWADTLRGHMGWASKYHYINPPDDPPRLCGMKYPQDCPSSGCVISAIQNYTSQILDTSLPHINRKNATMFVIHFLGDIHQPLHATGILRGGNDIRPVCWRRQPHNGVCTGPMSLHSVWDTQIPHRIRGLPPHLSPSDEKVAAAAWAADLHLRQERAGVNATTGQCVDLETGTCALGWASESNAFVCSHVLKPGLAFLKGNDLSEGYFEENWEVVEEVIGRAGVRLGAWLNAIAERLAGEKRPVPEEL
ncbi:S1/P1 Nuclease [Colletotrichum tofieldiae]|uniref:S1/P1 Nuclease n=1 Tax=Colletotrichum tofieldiae TaxID=708197 RepID=A0A166UNB4_9PEZI|nr:S1/P1 Nuclease [Colletotrichum tofieldiae]GKT64206.1 S1/P1 Nuclease [Colletotrichum tofieldiae]GKT74157.1 S1/P1 Nuclease [Colletotrichum tofieldiae]GKT97121.1 S1/P1 Nuclease [Colletotrichum tofieldiae]